MLRGREITRAALIAALTLWASSALAQVDGEHYAPGATCPTGAVAGHAVQPDWDTFFECNGSNKWQRGPYFFGASSDGCDGSHEGLTRYDSTAHNLYYCNGTSWVTINGNAAPTPGCGTSGTLSSQQQTTLNVAAGCTVQFKVWGAGGGQAGDAVGYYGLPSGNGGGGGYATITLGPLGSATTYYLVVGGGGGGNNCSLGGVGGADISGYTGGAGGLYDSANGYGSTYYCGCSGPGGGGASSVWTGSYGGTAVVVAGGGGGGGAGIQTGAPPGYAGGTGGSQNGSGVGGTGAGASAGSCSPGSGGGGGGYTTGGAGGPSETSYQQNGYPGYGGTNYAASGGSTGAGSTSSPGNAGDANRPSNAGAGATSAGNGNDGAIYYSTY